MNKEAVTTEQEIISKIYFIRGEKVMVDSDLAEMYGVETRVLNQAVKRHAERFPEDFMFRLSDEEWESLQLQLPASGPGWGGRRVSPFVFTEQGVAMLSGVLNSEVAIHVNIQIIRIFTRIRKALQDNKEVLSKLDQLERKLLKQEDYLKKHENEIQVIFQALKKLLHPSPAPRKKIGYKSRNEEMN